MKTVIIDYDAGNIFSVQQAFKRLGVHAVLSSNEGEIRSATHIVFPGVGHAKNAMKQLQEKGLDKVIPDLEQPVLGICLGMQLMCGWNEEGNLEGLGIFQTRIQSLRNLKSNLQICRFAKWQTDEFDKESCKTDTNYPVPQMGWNDVEINGKSDAFYFVHSYAAEICNDTWGIASYPTPFSAALKKDNFFGVQFHPEKSGLAGERLLKQFLKL